MHASGFGRSIVQSSTALLGALILIAGTLGCGKEQPSAGGESAVKETAPSAAPTAAPSANSGAEKKDDSAAAAKPEGTGSPEQAGAGTNENTAGKADPSKVAAAKPGETPAPAAPEPSATASAATTATPEPTSAAGTARAAETGPPVEGTKVGEANFSVWMQAAPKHKVGQPGSVQVVLVPKNGFKCNDAYPYKLKLNDPPAGVSYPTAIVRKESMSVSPKQSVMNVAFTPTAPGKARISGKFFFSVCTSDQCLIDSREVAVNVNIEQ